MQKRKKIYIASPLGFSESGRYFLYEKLIPMFNSLGLDVIDPWALTSPDLISPVAAMPAGEQKIVAWSALNRIIAENNTKGIIESDGVFAVLDGTDVDSGTAAEIGFASASGKIITGYRGDFRSAGDNEGSVVNLQVAWFIENSGGRITSSFSEAEEEIKRLFVTSSI
jgi:nucleoside 2-deoxyribosyltransferase